MMQQLSHKPQALELNPTTTRYGMEDPLCMLMAAAMRSPDRRGSTSANDSSLY